MDGIKIEVTGNIARVTEKPFRITSGTVGLPVEFSFDSQWDGLRKTALFYAGHVRIAVDGLETETIVPWEVLEKPCARLSIGVYGVNDDGSLAIPTTWANVSTIHPGADLDGDPGADPTLPIWQKILDFVGDLSELQTSSKGSLVDAINDAYRTATNVVRMAEITLLASKWVGNTSPYSQVVNIAGITPFSLVDIQLSDEQLEIFHEKDLAFTTENDNGVVTVYAIGDKPMNDYTIQATITEVKA